MTKVSRLVQEALGIVVSRQENGTHIADPMRIATIGPSFVGVGNDPQEAVSDLLAKLLFDSALSPPGDGYGEQVAALLRGVLR